MNGDREGNGSYGRNFQGEEGFNTDMKGGPLTYYHSNACLAFTSIQNTGNPPSADLEIHSAHYSSIHHSQDARRDPQSKSGVPVGSEGRGIGTSFIDQNPLIAQGLQSVMIQSCSTFGPPPTAFVSPLVSQPVDPLSTAPRQPVTPTQVHAPFVQLGSAMSANHGVASGALSPPNLLDRNASGVPVG